MKVSRELALVETTLAFGAKTARLASEVAEMLASEGRGEGVA